MEEDEIRDSYWTQTIEDWKSIKLTCSRCGTGFYEAINIGSLSCWQHPHYPAPGPGGIWQCCGMLCKEGRTGTNPGCVRADHTTLIVPFDEMHNVPIPKVIASGLLRRKFMSSVIVHPDSISNTEEYSNEEERAEADSYITVRRYSQKKAVNLQI